MNPREWALSLPPGLFGSHPSKNEKQKEFVCFGEYVENAQYLLIVLTKGVFHLQSIHNVLLASLDVPGLDVLPVSADKYFVYPGPQLYGKLEREGERGLHIAAAIRALMKIIAVEIS